MGAAHARCGARAGAVGMLEDSGRRGKRRAENGEG